MVMGYLVGQVVIFIKEIIRMMYVMDLERCIGVMVVIIRGNGHMEYKMDKVYIYIYIGIIFVPGEGSTRGNFKDNVLVDIFEEQPAPKTGSIHKNNTHYQQLQVINEKEINYKSL